MNPIAIQHVEHLHLHFHVDADALGNLQGAIMSAIDDLQAKVEQLTTGAADLSAKVQASNDKADSLITLVGSLRDQLAAMQANGATPEQVAALTAQIDGVLGTIGSTAAAADEQMAQDDAALGGTPTP